MTLTKSLLINWLLPMSKYIGPTLMVLLSLSPTLQRLRYPLRGYMKVVIDRFEGDFVVCEKEDRTILNINKRDVPVDSKEGDVLDIDGDIIKIDSAETGKRKKSVQ